MMAVEGKIENKRMAGAELEGERGNDSNVTSTRRLVQFWLLGLYVAVLVAANAAGSKLIDVGPLAASATVFAYAISFLVTDVTSEVYGRETANRFVMVGFVGVALAVAFFRIAVKAPAAEMYDAQKAFATVFSVTPRLLAGGFVAYLVSQFLDIAIFHRIREATGGRYMWVRNNVSTMCSQFVDTVIFIGIAFYGVVGDIWGLILGQYVIKLAIAAADTPLAYGLVWAIRSVHRSSSKKVEHWD